MAKDLLTVGLHRQRIRDAQLSTACAYHEVSTALVYRPRGTNVGDA